MSEQNFKAIGALDYLMPSISEKVNRVVESTKKELEHYFNEVSVNGFFFQLRKELDSTKDEGFVPSIMKLDRLIELKNKLELRNTTGTPSKGQGDQKIWFFVDSRSLKCLGEIQKLGLLAVDAQKQVKQFLQEHLFAKGLQADVTVKLGSINISMSYSEFHDYWVAEKFNFFKELKVSCDLLKVYFDSYVEYELPYAVKDKFHYTD